MNIPKVAIVGRPNVGKSSLFNAFLGKQIAIEDPTPGVTRDRLRARHVHEGRVIEIVDTGGVGIVDRQNLEAEVEGQIRIAIEEADLLLLVVDARDGVTPLDREAAALLRSRDRPVLLVANKVDSPKQEPAATEFFELGFGEPVLISARHKNGVSALLTVVLARLAESAPEEASVQPEPELKIAIVGKRNAGKSTFLNSIAGSVRVIVSEVPGTTRDSIDVEIEKDGRRFVAIDTAGLRRERSVETSVEFYSHARTRRAIERADVVLLMVDAATPISIVDKKIAEMVRTEEKPCVLVVNKWDLAKKQKDITTEDYEEYLGKMLPGLGFAPIAFTTATSGKNVIRTLDVALSLVKQASGWIGTGELNRVLHEIMDSHPPRTKKRTQPKVYYAAQVGANPPTIVMIANAPGSFPKDYLRYLEGRIRQKFRMEEIPLRLVLKARGPSRKRARSDVDERGGSAPPSERQHAVREANVAPAPPLAKDREPLPVSGPDPDDARA